MRLSILTVALLLGCHKPGVDHTPEWPPSPGGRSLVHAESGTTYILPENGETTNVYWVVSYRVPVQTRDGAVFIPTFSDMDKLPAAIGGIHWGPITENLDGTPGVSTLHRTRE